MGIKKPQLVKVEAFNIFYIGGFATPSANHQQINSVKETAKAGPPAPIPPLPALKKIISRSSGPSAVLGRSKQTVYPPPSLR